MKKKKKKKKKKKGTWYRFHIDPDQSTRDSAAAAAAADTAAAVAAGAGGCAGWSCCWNYCFVCNKKKHIRSRSNNFQQFPPLIPLLFFYFLFVHVSISISFFLGCFLSFCPSHVLYELLSIAGLMVDVGHCYSIGPERWMQREIIELICLPTIDSTSKVLPRRQTTHLHTRILTHSHTYTHIHRKEINVCVWECAPKTNSYGNAINGVSLGFIGDLDSWMSLQLFCIIAPECVCVCLYVSVCMCLGMVPVSGSDVFKYHCYVTCSEWIWSEN